MTQDSVRAAASGKVFFTALRWLWVSSYLNLLKLYWAKRSFHAYFPLWKSCFVDGSWARPLALAQHVLVRHCSLPFSCRSFFPLSFWHIVISLRLLLWPLTVQLHPWRTFTGLHSGFRRPPTYPHIHLQSHLLPFSTSLYECMRTYGPNRTIFILAFVLLNGKWTCFGEKGKN